MPMTLMRNNLNEPLTSPQEQSTYKYQNDSISLSTYMTILVPILIVPIVV